MSNYSKVVWTEGMFLRPQHFQQHDRYIENRIEDRCSGLRPFDWGYSEFELDEGALLHGKIKLNKAKGIFQDGTPFNMVNEGNVFVKDISPGVNNQIIYLCLPMLRENQVETDFACESDNLSRFRGIETDVRDNNAGYKESYTIQIGRLQPQILLEKDERSGFWCLGITKILEVLDDKTIRIDKNFIPPVLSCKANPILRDFLIELKGLLHGRGDMLAGRVAGLKQVVAVEDLKDLTQLQTINRYESLLTHLAQHPLLHPEEFFMMGLQLIGDLATIYDAAKRPKEMPIYNHDNLQDSLIALIKDLRRLLNVVVQDNVRQIAIEVNDKNISMRRTAQISGEWLQKARFVLIVYARMDQDTLKTQFQDQVKLSSPWNRVDQLKQLNLRGILLTVLNIIPRGIPIYNDHIYFEIDKQCDEWKLALADPDRRIWFYIGGNFPEFKLELWATRE